MNHFLKLLFILCAVILCGVKAYAQSNKIDSLKKVLLTAKEDTNKVNALNDLALTFQYNIPDSTILLAQQAVALSEKINFATGKAIAYANLGIGYWAKGDYSKSLEKLFIALEAEEAMNNKSGMAKRMGNIGLLYKEQGNFAKALDYSYKALKMSEELGDKKRIAIQLNTIGIIYDRQANYQKALDSYFRALKIIGESDNKKLNALLFGNIGLVYSAQSKHDQALKFYFKALKMDEDLGNKNGIARHLGNIGLVYSNQTDFPKALKYYKKALELDEEIGNKNGIAIRLGNIGNVYTLTGNFKNAEEYLIRSLKMCDTTRALFYTKSFEKYLSQLYDTTGRYELALVHYKKFIAARDSIASDENTKKQTQAEMQYLFDKKEAGTKTEQDKKDTVTKIVIYSVSGGLFLVLILAGFIFRSYRLKQKANTIITQQKKEVERQKQLVEEKQKNIVDSIHYARRIQQSLLPTEKYIERNILNLRERRQN